MLSWTLLPSWGILLNMKTDVTFHQTFEYVVACAISLEGAQWLSGRVLDSKPRGRGVEPHVVPLSKNINPS